MTLTDIAERAKTSAEAEARARLVKFCKDCRFCKRAADGSLKYAECTAPQNMLMRTNPVTGEQERVGKYVHCSTLRIGADDCGEAAAWFEPGRYQEQQS